MKKTTCKAMGGTCDVEIHGETAQEIMQKGKQHVYDAADAGDESHKEVVERMKALSEEEHAKWSEEFMAKFNSLDEA